MKSFVVDTNVGIVANDRDGERDPDCVLACVEALDDARQGRVVIDSGMRILDEYRRHLSPAGEPGLGDAFMKWLWDRQADTRHVEQADITPYSSDPDDFEQFPRDKNLVRFDRSDRKFVAVALAAACRPSILNATDRDWWEFRAGLEAVGVRVRFVCPSAMGARSARSRARIRRRRRRAATRPTSS